MKFDLDVSTKASLNYHQTLSLKIRVTAGFFWNFTSASSKRDSPEDSQKSNLLHMNYSYIFTIYNFSNIFKIFLPNVLHPLQTVKMSIKVCEDLENNVQMPKLKSIWVC